MTIDPLNRPPSLFSPDKADSLAKTLRDDQEGDDFKWNYVVRHDPTGSGFSFITVYDEAGEYLGNL